MIKSENTVSIYEINEEEVDYQSNSLCVNSYWNGNTKIVLEFQGKSITVVAKDLLAAIENSTNTATY